MNLSIADVANELEQRRALIRARADHSAQIIERVSEEIGQQIPQDLEAFYRERIARVGDFLAISPPGNTLPAIPTRDVRTVGNTTRSASWHSLVRARSIPRRRGFKLVWEGHNRVLAQAKPDGARRDAV